MEKGNQGIKWSSLIMGVLLLMLAVVIFTFPIENFYAITWLIGLFVLINGVIQIIYRRKAKALGGNQNWILFMGIVDILFGLIVIFNVGASSAFFIYMFAFWFIFSSIAGLFTFTGSGSLKLISVIFNLLGIVFGVILLFNPLMGIVFISTMIAIAFVFVGVIYVVDALA
ncbi:TPA: HdeD family acid-resistance protein [Staphylococcus aureus]|nr:HdeD family acid-resistance protein [Staphylococcus aureus]HEI9448899.1 HdeD family acid-resistance protein [Staphylococcus aureus]HEI9473842.1 HdeD family acid-resistance protein [Staphylococcus aureus]HEI9504505.1 HdeD family acid-resistance protein [Staphylococcus aureus]HEI9510191.1 HdeD family acid-resistance protein [Staphylococcus aureus]